MTAEEEAAQDYKFFLGARGAERDAGSVAVNLLPRGTCVLTHHAVKLLRHHDEPRLQKTKCEVTAFLPDVETDLDVEGRLPDARPHLVIVARVEETVQDGGYLERDRRRVMVNKSCHCCAHSQQITS